MSKAHPIDKFNVTKNNYEKMLDNQDFFEYCYEYWMDEMPYGTAKARTGDPGQWLFDKLEEELCV